MGIRLEKLIRDLSAMLEVYGDIEVEKECHETYGTIRNKVDSAEIEISHNPFKRTVLL